MRGRFVLVLCILFPLTAAACTLWGAVGEAAGGGTLLAKNRDWFPDHRQYLKKVRPVNGHVFLGLYVEGNDSPGLKAGINDRGLSIVSASSNIPRKIRNSQAGVSGVMARILAHYADIDAVLADAPKLFAHARANFYLLSDRRRLLLVEVGLAGQYAVHVQDRGALAHTNHYLDTDLAGRYNRKIGQSSRIRLQRINSLLEQTPTPYDMERFATFSRDQHDGPDNSLWRSGREHTLAAWLVAAPAVAPARLRVVIANPGERESTQEFTLDDAFWHGQ